MIFPVELQRSFLSLLLRDRQISLVYLDSAVSHLTDPVLQRIAKEIFSFRRKFGRMPSEEDLVSWLSNRTKDPDALIPVARKLYHMEIVKDYVLEETERYLRYSSALEAAQFIVDNAKKMADDPDMDFGSFRERVMRLLSYRAILPTLDYFSSLEEIVSNLSPDMGEAFPTGLPSLDRQMIGVFPGEVATVASLPNGGKSAWMVFVTAHALRLGKFVVYLTLELSAEAVARRITRSLLGLPMQDLLSRRPKALVKQLRRFHLENKALLEIIYAPSDGSFSTFDIREHLTALELQFDRPVDMLVVDYGTLLRSSRRYSDRRFEYEDIWRNLHAIAGIYKIPVWTGAQIRRAAFESLSSGVSFVFRGEDLQEAYNIKNETDILLTLTPQLKREKKYGRLHPIVLFLDKCRDRPRDTLQYCWLDPEKMRFEEQTEEEVVGYG